MDHFTREELKQLAETTSDPAISIYLPMYRAGREVRQNAIRFKNMLNQASREMADAGVDEQRAQSLLADASHLSQRDDWWQHQSDGLALFLGEGRSEAYRVPIEFDEFLSVGRRFHIRPMVSLLQGDGRFYVLAVSQNRVRLLEGTRFSVDELETDRLPSDLRSALNIDEYTRTRQQHSTEGAAVAGNTIFHGQGAANMDVQKRDELTQYFRLVSDSLDSFLDDQRTPLVFAGVDYLFPLFRDTCHHHGLVDQPVSGNPDELAAEQLHQRAWPIVAPIFSSDRAAAIARYEDLAGSDRASGDLSVIIRAARSGAVETLLLAQAAQQWGRVDEQSGSFTPTDGDADGAEELLNDAAVHTLTTGGTVYCLPHDESLPKQAFAAAILRFPVA